MPGEGAEFIVARASGAKWEEIPEDRANFVGTSWIVDKSVKKGHPIETRRIYVHSEDEIPKIDSPTENDPYHCDNCDDASSSSCG